MTTQSKTQSQDLLAGTRQVPAGTVQPGAAAPSSCCAPQKQEVCCEPSEKSSCCGTGAASGGSCGCQ